MPLLDILIHPDRRLRKTAEPVSQFTNALKTITDNMFATMYEAHGIGLAATQVNIHQRIVVMDVRSAAKMTKPKPRTRRFPIPSSS